MVSAFTIPKPESEVIITTSFDGVDVSWPIVTEARAYKLATEVGAAGFWRLKHKANLQPHRG
jgi:hypothetical protein